MFLRRVLIFTLLALFSLGVLGYGTYKALPIILGPRITVNTPSDGEIVSGTSISISGTVLRTKALYINSIPTAFSEAGDFSSRLPVYPGSNILILEAYDRFGRVTTLTLNIGTQN